MNRSRQDKHRGKPKIVRKKGYPNTAMTSVYLSFSHACPVTVKRNLNQYLVTIYNRDINRHIKAFI